MNHRVWFTLVVRAIGLLFVGFTVGSLPGFVSQVIAHSQNDWGESRLFAIGPALLWTTLAYLGTFVQLGLGLYLLLGGKWLIDRCLIDAGAEPGNIARTESPKPA